MSLESFINEELKQLTLLYKDYNDNKDKYLHPKNIDELLVSEQNWSITAVISKVIDNIKEHIFDIDTNKLDYLIIENVYKILPDWNKRINEIVNDIGKCKINEIEK